jgi:hypothetical protein
MKRDELIGQPITGVFLSDDKEYIKFVTPKGDCVLMAYGDCCSHTWIENVDLFGDLSVVESLEHTKLREDGEVDYEVIRYYGLEIKMTRGTITVDYRNSSNGYYGGELTDDVGSWDWEEPDPATTWKEIT